MVQSEKKKSEVEAELEKINTQLNVIVTQLHDTNAEKEELEMYITTEEYQELDKKLQSVVEEIKILDKVINTLSASTDHNRTKNNVFDVMESVKACTGEGAVSSRKKVSYYCYEQVEQALHKTQLNLNNPVDFSESPHEEHAVNLNMQQKTGLNRTLSSTPWGVMSNAHYAGEDSAGSRHEGQGNHNESVGNRIAQYASVRENGKQSSYLSIPYNGNLQEGSSRETSLTYATWNASSNTCNPEFQANSFRQLPGKQLTSENYYSQYQNMCFSEKCPQEAYASKTGSLPQYYGQSKNDCSQKMINSPGKHFWPSHSMMYYPSVGNLDNPLGFSGNGMPVRYPQYETPIPNHSLGAMGSLDRCGAPLRYSRGQGRPVHQEHGLPKETWPGSQRWYSGRGTPLSDYDTRAHNIMRNEIGGCESNPQVPKGGDWSGSKQTSVLRQPIYTSRSPRKSNQLQQDQRGSYAIQHNPLLYSQWCHSTDANNAGGSYHQTCTSDSNKENSSNACAWRPKVRVAHRLQAFGDAGDSGKLGGVSSASETSLKKF